LAGLDLLIANAAFDLIQGVLQSLSTSTETALTSQMKNKMLAPGLTLFISILESSFKSSQFLTNELIIQDAYVYEVHFSIKEGESVVRLSDLEAYEDAKQTARHSITRIDKAIEGLTLGDNLDAYIRKVDMYDAILDAWIKRLGDLSAKIAALSGKPPAPPAAARRDMVGGALPREDDEAIPYLREKVRAILAAHY
jgi:hypothetical protein